MTPIASAPSRVALTPAYVTIDQGPASVTDGSTTPLGITQPASLPMRAWHA